MKLYREWSPSQFDTKGLGCDDRQDWSVVGVIQTRDSTCLERSNFRTTLRILGGESDTVEVHRFGHWGPGWFEIILVSPDADPKVLEEAESIGPFLAEQYPVLSDSDYSDLQWEEAEDYWSHMNLRDRAEACKRYGVSIFAARRDEVPMDGGGELVGYLADGC